MKFSNLSFLGSWKNVLLHNLDNMCKKNKAEVRSLESL